LHFCLQDDGTMTAVGQSENCDGVGGTWIGDYGFPPIRVDAAWPEGPGSAPATDPFYDGSNAPTVNWGAGLEDFSGNSSPSPTWAAIKTFFTTLPSTGPGSCLAVFQEAAAEPLLTTYHATEGALEVGAALIATSLGAGSLANSLLDMKRANPMFGGQLDPFLGPKVIAGARVVASVTGRFGLAAEHAAAAYLAPAALTAGVVSLAYGVYQEGRAALNGTCH